jgi:hypothetical protein
MVDIVVNSALTGAGMSLLAPAFHDALSGPLPAAPKGNARSARASLVTQNTVPPLPQVSPPATGPSSDGADTTWGPTLPRQQESWPASAELPSVESGVLERLANVLSPALEQPLQDALPEALRGAPGASGA